MFQTSVISFLAASSIVSSPRRSISLLRHRRAVLPNWQLSFISILSFSSSVVPFSHFLCYVTPTRTAFTLSRSALGLQNPITRRNSNHLNRQHSFLHSTTTNHVESKSNNMESAGTNNLNDNKNDHPNFLSWDDAKHIAIPNCIMPLSPTSHKGSSGRIGVIGGSARYTGAPYYAAMAALQVGADLVNVFCAEEAALPIKCYSPELMVVPVYPANEFDQIVIQQEQGSEMEKETSKQRAEYLIDRMVKEVVSMMDRLHVLVIGPGLGRCPMVMQATAQIIQEARCRELALVLDADALFLLTLPEYQTLLIGYSKAILTPNRVEYQRLKAVHENQSGTNSDDAFRQALDQNVLIVKGRFDQVIRIGIDSSQTDGSSSCLTCAEVGGMKRSGGIGDVLAGTLGACVAWHEILSRKGNLDNAPSPTLLTPSQDMLLWSCWTACCITKQATKRAFDMKKRAMTAPDILKEIGATVEHMTTPTTNV